MLASDKTISNGYQLGAKQLKKETFRKVLSWKSIRKSKISQNQNANVNWNSLSQNFWENEKKNFHHINDNLALNW